MSCKTPRSFTVAQRLSLLKVSQEHRTIVDARCRNYSEAFVAPTALTVLSA